MHVSMSHAIADDDLIAALAASGWLSWQAIMEINWQMAGGNNITLRLDNVLAAIGGVFPVPGMAGTWGAWQVATPAAKRSPRALVAAARAMLATVPPGNRVLCPVDGKRPTGGRLARLVGFAPADNMPGWWEWRAA